MNWSQILNLQWDNEFHISSTHQLFRTIKWRAAGKECSFEIPVGFMPRFKNFIRLRNYLLNNQKFEYLFFTAGERGSGTPKQVKSFTLHGIYSAIKRIDPLLPTIQSREWHGQEVIGLCEILTFNNSTNFTKYRKNSFIFLYCRF